MDNYEDPLPHFAIEKFDGIIKVGALLATRDGRRMGNGVVTDIKEKDPIVGMDLYYVMTDFGNTVRLTLSELKSAFYEPIWICDVDNWGGDIIRNHGGANGVL